MTRPGMSARRRRDALVFAGLAAAWLLLTLVVRNSYYQLMLTLVPIWAVAGLSWNLFSGYSGLTSFGHAAFFGVGAYTVSLLVVHAGLTPWLGLPLAAAAGAVAALLIGLPTLRLRGHYFALAMLAYPLVFLYVLQYLGFQEVALPMQRDAGAWWMQFADPRAFTLVAVILLAIAFAVSVAVETSRFGLMLMAIRENELAAAAAGIDPWRWKMLALMVSGALAAMAGGLYACVLLVVTPDAVFGMLTSAQALVMALFGGVGTYWGPLIGAAVLIPLAETLQAELGDIIPGIQGVVYGGAIIAIMLLAPEGLFWSVRDRFFRPRPAPLVLPPVRIHPIPETGPAGTLLAVAGLCRRFGGLRAVDEVAFSVERGKILGIIGPNGAGKTTLLNVINGVLPPSAGGAVLDGTRLSGRRLHAICRLGVGRTFQVVRSFPRLQLFDNALVGAYGAGLTGRAAIEATTAAIDRVGLRALAAVPAGQLTNKQLRLMELARALAGAPRLLLLDETLAGLGGEECDAVLDVLRQLKREGMTIVIIEHTMHAMLRLADTFLVIDHGRVLAEGQPRAVLEDARVIEAYLGSKWASRAAASKDGARRTEDA